MNKLSIAMEQYLEIIYELSPNNEGVHLTSLAKTKNVSKASANQALNFLASQDLVDYNKYQLIFLTTKGIEYATITNHKHQTIKSFFIKTLNIDSQLADSDACLIEHVIDYEIIKAMDEYLKKS
jgi:Mn-dependent DtxR family transcriptional regulator